MTLGSMLLQLLMEMLVQALMGMLLELVLMELLMGKSQFNWYANDDPGDADRTALRTAAYGGDAGTTYCARATGSNYAGTGTYGTAGRRPLA